MLLALGANIRRNLFWIGPLGRRQHLPPTSVTEPVNRGRGILNTVVLNLAAHFLPSTPTDSACLRPRLRCKLETPQTGCSCVWGAMKESGLSILKLRCKNTNAPAAFGYSARHVKRGSGHPRAVSPIR
jgi:hypothetical protein